MNSDHDPELGRLFAEARAALPAEEFVAGFSRRLALARRRRLLVYLAVFAVAIAALLVLAPWLISGSLALSTDLTTATSSSLVWIVSLITGLAVVLWTRRGLRR